MREYLFIRIPGIFTSKKRQNIAFWEEVINTKFPGSQIMYFHLFYGFFSKKKLYKYMESIIEEMNASDKSLILIGQSFGSFVCQNIAIRDSLKKRPILIVQYAPPLYLKFLASLILGKNTFHHKTPTISFYGENDFLVPSLLAELDKSNEAYSIPGRHFSCAKGDNLEYIIPKIEVFLENNK